MSRSRICGHFSDILYSFRVISILKIRIDRKRNEIRCKHKTYFMTSRYTTRTCKSRHFERLAIEKDVNVLEVESANYFRNLTNSCEEDE